MINIDVSMGKLTLSGEWGKTKKVFHMYKGKPKYMIGAKVGAKPIVMKRLWFQCLKWKEAIWRATT